MAKHFMDPKKIVWLLQFMNYILEPALRAVFFQGPPSLGFWGSQQLYDVCAALTSMDATFWKTHRLECFDLCERKFQAFYVMVRCALYVALLYYVVSSTLAYFFVIRPLQRMLMYNANTREVTSMTEQR
jgi:hypothetical protein